MSFDDEEEEEEEEDEEEYVEVQKDAEDDEGDEDVDLDDELIQPRCLPLNGPPLPPSEEPPKDADEYLRRVQWERIHSPSVVCADVKERPARKRIPHDGRYNVFSQLKDPEVPQEMQPSPEWTQDAVAAFVALRERCAAGDSGVEQEHVSQKEWAVRCRRDAPSTELLKKQDFLSVQQLIRAVVEAIDEALDNGTAISCIDVRLAAWAFAAFAVVEEPLLDNVQADCQLLRRICLRVLAGVGKDDETCNTGSGARQKVSAAAAARARASLLLVIVREVFHQR